MIHHPKEDWIRAVCNIRLFLLRHDISLKGIRIAVHVPNSQTQHAIETALKRDFDSSMLTYMTLTNQTLPPHTFEVMGIAVTIVNPEKWDLR